MKRQFTDLREPRPAKRPQGGSCTEALPGPAPAPVAEAVRPAEREPLSVLVVEGDERAAECLVVGLRRHGYQAQSVGTGAKALRVHPHADLVLLDLDLPDLDGLEVCRSIRAACDTPVIAVTARDTELDRVLGLQAGSDDYMIKPYGFRELMARMEAVMRRVRSHPSSAEEQVVEHGPLRIYAGIREIRLDGQLITATRKEFDLLHLLASRPEHVFSRKELMVQVWDDAWSRSGRTIDTHVSNLRSKLGSCSWIVTLRGVGFRFGHP
ncbi:response regulator transcription factor [Streptomyces cyaneofuscatus]|uniref:response regulator transcription factor n=1 Tax=Streptomyces cyaneofuscatus TaxID=66883 RepID=UPI00364A3504